MSLLSDDSLFSMRADTCSECQCNFRSSFTSSGCPMAYKKQTEDGQTPNLTRHFHESVLTFVHLNTIHNNPSV